MKNETRIAYKALAEQVAKLNNVGSAAEKFDVQPSIQQRLENAIQESNDYLQRVNFVGVDEMSGEKLKLGVSGPMASRTDTTTKERTPKERHKLGSNGYKCEKTDFDTAFKYVTLDSWAKFPDFQTRLSGMLATQQGLDRLMIGWNGTHAAKDTNIADNPLLQDVNVGWLQSLRDDAPSQVMSEIKPGSKQVRVGPGGDYENLDALVFDALTLLAPWYQEDTGVLAHVGRKLMHDKYFPMINRQQRATDELATQVILSQKAIGGRTGIAVPFFPANSLLLTRPDNLSLYYQNGKRRRQLIDEPRRDQVADYQSSNDAYVVERLDGAVLVENIVIGDWSKPTDL